MFSADRRIIADIPHIFLSQYEKTGASKGKNTVDANKVGEVENWKSVHTPLGSIQMREKMNLVSLGIVPCSHVGCTMKRDFTINICADSIHYPVASTQTKNTSSPSAIIF